MLLPPAARELADPDRRQLQRRLLGGSRLPRKLSTRLRRGLSTVRRALSFQVVGPDAVPVLPERQERLQGQGLVARIVALAARRAFELPGLLGAPLFRDRLS